MAYAASGLALIAFGNDKKVWRYDTATDAMATVETAGYFNNTTNSTRMSADDTIEIHASNGVKTRTVASVSATGAVTLGASMMDSSAIVTIVATTGAGFPSTVTELPGSGLLILNSTSTGNGSWGVAAPYAGADLKIFNLNSSTLQVLLHLSTAAGTTPTWDGTNDDAVFTLTGQALHVVGLSATRFGIMSNSTEAGAASVVTFA